MALAAAVAGCTSYQAKPLDPPAILAEVDRQRRGDDAASTAESAAEAAFTFAQAARWMAEHGPDLREARSQYETALAVSRVPTPLPNPTIQAGLQHAFGPDVGPIRRVQPFGGLGLTLPLGRTRACQNELNRVIAERLHVELEARHREIYLDLRRSYAQWCVAAARIETGKKVGESFGKSVALSRQLVEAGVATSLDVGLLELEQGRAEAAVLSARHDLAGLERELSRLIGVHAERFVAPSEPLLPDLPDEPPAPGELIAVLLDHHPALARLRAQYEEAEATLRLEIARQWPDLQIGTPFSSDPDVRRTVIGLSLGLELPLLDRNQPGIAKAHHQREEVRLKYEAAANRALADIEGARQAAARAADEWRFVRQTLLPRAEKNVDLAQRQLQAGSGDTLGFLTAQRARAELVVEALEAELSLREAWVDLEQAIGKPLLHFPGESDAGRPGAAQPEVAAPSATPESPETSATPERPVRRRLR